MAFIEFEHVTRAYGEGPHRVIAANDVSFHIDEGELCIILGPSGAGKSTVLNLLGGMDNATSGSIRVGGQDITTLRKDALAEYRRRTVGFVFQFYNLIPNLTARENVELAAQLVEGSDRPETTLAAVGLAERANNFPGNLSGGEQQRVSVARAICKAPTLLLCDEPTGALDSATGADVMALLASIARDRGTTVVIITHNHLAAPMADRVIRMKNGSVESVECNPSPARPEDISW